MAVILQMKYKEKAGGLLTGVGRCHVWSRSALHNYMVAEWRRQAQEHAVATGRVGLCFNRLVTLTLMTRSSELITVQLMYYVYRLLYFCIHSSEWTGGQRFPY